MKKIVKLFIAVLIIAAIAVGAYFIFNKGTDNTQIRAKVYGLNNQQNYVSVNETIVEMLSDIQTNGYALDEAEAYFVAFNQSIQNYELIEEQIIANGLFVNSNNTGAAHKQMTEAYGNVQNIYSNASAYLKDTYWVSKNKVYIENFYNIFKDALTTLNSFYYNAGVAYLMSIDNAISTNNLYKLNLECYLIASNQFVQNFVSEGENGLEALALIQNKRADINMDVFDSYIQNKATIDKLYSGAGINKTLIVEKYIAGELSTYIDELTNEDEKSATNSYYEIVIK